MRAVKDRPWQPVGRSAQPHRALYRRPAERTGRSGIGVWLGLGAALLLGYIPGVWIGRDGGFGISALAEHYLDKQTYAAFGPVFADLFAAAFVQSTLLLLCGFCALGLGLLAAFFSLKGMYLGYCAASIYAAGGAKSLTAHWLLSLLPDLGVLAALLCLAGHAVPLSVALLQTAFGESTVPSATYARARTLILRYALTVAVTALCSGLGALLDVFLAGVLL